MAKATAATGASRSDPPRRKLIAFDPETWLALDGLARDRMADIQELADEAFADLLRKHGRPVGLKQALRQSAGKTATKKAAKEPAPRRRRPSRSRG
jgi:hypothetical protein